MVPMVQALDGQQRVLLRSSQNQSCDDVRNTHRRCFEKEVGRNPVDFKDCDS